MWLLMAWCLFDVRHFAFHSSLFFDAVACCRSPFNYQDCVIHHIVLTTFTVVFNHILTDHRIHSYGKVHQDNIRMNFDFLLDGCGSVSNHQPHDCLLNRLFRRRSKKTQRLRNTALCARNLPGTGEFPAQMTSNAENVSIWRRHHGNSHSRMIFSEITI